MWTKVRKYLCTQGTVGNKMPEAKGHTKQEWGLRPVMIWKWVSQALEARWAPLGRLLPALENGQHVLWASFSHLYNGHSLRFVCAILWPLTCGACVRPRQHIEKQRRYFVNKGPSSQGYGFSCGHVWMWELDCEERWALKNWCFWTVVLEKTLESPLDCKEIQPVHPKGDQSSVFIGRTDAEAENPILGHLMWRADSFEKTLMLGKIEGRRRRG